MIDIVFLKELNIEENQIILDFGCGEGDYTIPAAKLVGHKGTIYAVDKSDNILSNLMKTAELEGLENIVPINTKSNLTIPLPNEFVDVVLLFDILHYFNALERNKVYTEVNRILKPKGFLLVYPKHNKHDWPLWHLSDMTLNEIIEEIKAKKFHFKEKRYKNLIHDGGPDKGFILIFNKITHNSGN